MQTQTLTPENYVLRFGQYKNMRAVDVAEIYEIDKTGNEYPKGRMYLQFLCKTDWFRHTDILQKIINKAISDISDDEDRDHVHSSMNKDKKTKKDKKPKEKTTRNIVNFD